VSSHAPREVRWKKGGPKRRRGRAAIIQRGRRLEAECPEFIKDSIEIAKKAGGKKEKVVARTGHDFNQRETVRERTAISSIYKELTAKQKAKDFYQVQYGAVWWV